MNCAGKPGQAGAAPPHWRGELFGLYRPGSGEHGWNTGGTRVLWKGIRLEVEVLWLEKTTNKQKIELEASLAPAEAEVWKSLRKERKKENVGEWINERKENEGDKRRVNLIVFIKIVIGSTGGRLP